MTETGAMEAAAARPERVAVIGATGRTGPHVVRALCDAGFDVIAIGRDAGRLAVGDARARRSVAAIEDRAGLAAAIDGADAAVCLAPHETFGAVLAALPNGCARVVAAGSIRKYSRFDDPIARSARQTDAVFAASGRQGVVLNFSLIYGQPEDRTINRVIAMVRRFPAGLSAPLVLPDGGRHLLQPIFIDDMTACVHAALVRPEACGASIDVAGPRAITYREMVEACAAAIGRTVLVLPVPSRPLIGAVRALERAGLRLPVASDELARASEDKIVDIGAMRARLGVDPVPFEEGLRRKRERGWLAAR
jgi:nucleoside-diphosphate-sugar epimerase